MTTTPGHLPAPAGHADSGQAPRHLRRTGEPHLASVASWAVLVASFGLSAATWIALAELAGFTGHLSTPVGVTLHLSWLMPIAVDGYVVTALVLWMSPVPAKVAEFAKTNTYAAAFIGVAAQSAFHCLSIWALTAEMWQAVLAAVVGAIPPAGAALAVHMRALIRRESGQVSPPTLLVDAGQVQVSEPDTGDMPVAADTRTPEVAGQADTPAIERTPEADTPTGQVVSIADRPARSRTVPVADTPDTAALADTLTAKFGGEYVGTPKALEELRRVYGSCSKDRAIDAKNLHNARREATA
jgi:hypothetical protein